MAVKRIKLSNKYIITGTVEGLTGADKLGLKLGDEIDAGDGRFTMTDVALSLVPELREPYTSGIVAFAKHLTKSGKHELQVGDTVTVKKGLTHSCYHTKIGGGRKRYNFSMSLLQGNEYEITDINSEGELYLGCGWVWLPEWLVFKSPKAPVAPKIVLPVPKVEVTQGAQPTNPFDRKDLEIPEWATHAAHSYYTGTWYFFNMKPEQHNDRPYFKLNLDNRTTFKWQKFSHNYQHANWLDSIVERYIQFKVGELVRVKDVVVGVHQSKLINSSNTFVSGMSKNIGETFKISVARDTSYSLEGDIWNYLPDWLERVEVVKVPEPTPPVMTPKQLLKQRQQTFKVGDRVVLVGGKLDEVTIHGAAIYNSDKQKHQGEVAIIKTVYVSDCDITLTTLDGEFIGWVSPDWIVKESEYKDTKYSHYFKDVSTLNTVDVYQVLSLFNITNPCLQHIVKKALVTGGRTAGKDFSQDLREIRDTAIRAVEMDEGSKTV